MPFCPSCGRQVGEEDSFCPSCGQALPVETTEELVSEAPRGAAQFERGPLLIRHLRRDEKVLWSGKPVKTAFLFSGAGGGGLVGVLIAVPVVLAFFGVWASMVAVTGAPSFFFGFGLLFLAIVVFAAAGSPIWQLMRYPNTEYMITNQRLVTQTGAIGLDTRFVDLDRIQEVYVKVGLVDKLFGTGSVIVVTAGFVPVGTTRRGALVRPSLEALREPYKVQNILQEATEERA